MSSRWIVRTAVLTPEVGNGIWSFHRTRFGAELTRFKILGGEWRGGFYTLPKCGLSVVRFGGHQ